MKWIWSTAFVVVAVSAAVSAQSARQMNEATMADQLNMTYTGCVEAVNHGGSFLLTHVGDDHQAGPAVKRMPTMMNHDAMMKTDSEMAKKDDPSASNEMHGDHVMPSAVVLTGRSDLKKHVGQKVTVTGSLSHGMSETMSNAPDTLAVASLKVVAKSCS
jgi:hypothetical protein